MWIHLSFAPTRAASQSTRRQIPVKVREESSCDVEMPEFVINVCVCVCVCMCVCIDEDIGGGDKVAVSSSNVCCH